MFENIGGKIKTMVVVVAVISLIACVIMFFAGNAAYMQDKDYIKYATVYGGAYGYPSLQAAGDNAYNGLQLKNSALPLAIGILIAFLPMYGFGVIVEGCEVQTEKLSQLIEEQKKTNEYLKNLHGMSAAAPNTKANEPANTVDVYLPEL